MKFFSESDTDMLLDFMWQNVWKFLPNLDKRVCVRVEVGNLGGLREQNFRFHIFEPNSYNKKH